MFFVLVGMTLIAAAAVFLIVPKDRRDKDVDRRVDWIGAALVTASLVCLLFVLAQGEVASNGWATGCECLAPFTNACADSCLDIIALLVLSVIGIGCFVAWEYHLEQRTTFPPLMRLTLWTRAKGRFAVMQLVGFFTWIAFMSWGYWATLL